ncbi:hypothetical protein N566_06580 [Streptomycetaceae bacterium MP113-05]|nr:hypothetical protein N566_06580 [Streptomycetaceae bacterium MP113-05]
MHILIIENDDGVATALEQALGAHGYRTSRAATGGEAVGRIHDMDLVLLDLGLPDLDGHEVCRRIRERSCVPVIALSGRSEELERVMVLHLGADDFVLKPFSRHELMARIQALFRRARACPGHTPARLVAAPLVPPQAAAPAVAHGSGGHADRPRTQTGPLHLDPRTRKVFLDREEVRVTRKEFDLLAMLMEEPGTVMRRQAIMSQVWDENWFGSTRTLDVHVGSLRSKLGSADWIETVRGVGYRLTVPAAALVDAKAVR